MSVVSMQEDANEARDENRHLWGEKPFIGPAGTPDLPPVPPSTPSPIVDAPRELAKSQSQFRSRVKRSTPRASTIVEAEFVDDDCRRQRRKKWVGEARAYQPDAKQQAEVSDDVERLMPGDTQRLAK
jgi:hypothetical protein